MGRGPTAGKKAEGTRKLAFLKKNQQHLNNSTIRNKVNSRNKTSFDSGQQTMRNKIRFTINKILSRHEKSTN